MGSLVRRCKLTAGRAVARSSLSCHRTCRQLILYTKTTSPTRCRHHAREAARVRPRTTKTTTSGERTRTLSRCWRRSASYLPFPRAVKRRCASRRTRRYAVLGEGGRSRSPHYTASVHRALPPATRPLGSPMAHACRHNNSLVICAINFQMYEMLQHYT